MTCVFDHTITPMERFFGGCEGDITMTRNKSDSEQAPAEKVTAPRRSVLRYGSLAAIPLGVSVGSVPVGGQTTATDGLESVAIYMLDAQLYRNEPFAVVAGPLARMPTVTDTNGFRLDLSNHDAYLVQYLDAVNQFTVVFPHKGLNFEIGDEFEVVPLTAGERNSIEDGFEFKIRETADGRQSGDLPPIPPDVVAVVFPLPVSFYQR